MAIRIESRSLNIESGGGLDIVGSTRTRKEEQFLGGGTFSDIIDIAQTPQFALTGLLSGRGIREGVKTRLLPSKLAGLEGTPGKALAGFALDVATDPLLFLGFLGSATKVGKAVRLAKFTRVEEATAAVNALKALGRVDDAARLAKGIKAGETVGQLTKIADAAKIFESLTPAATLGGAARAGQRAALTLDVPFAKSLQGIPLVPQAVSEAVLGGATKLGQPVRRLLGDDLARQLRITPAAPKGSTINQIEEFAKRDKQFAEFVKNLDAKVRARVAIQADSLGKLSREFETLKKAGKITSEAEANIYKKLADPQRFANIALDPDAQRFFAILSKQSDDLQQLWIKKGGAILEGSGLPNVLTKQAKEAITEAKRAFPGAARQLGGKTESDIFASITRFIDDQGRATVGTLDDLGLKKLQIDEALDPLKSPVVKSLERLTTLRDALKTEIEDIVKLTPAEIQAIGSKKSKATRASLKEIVEQTPKGEKIRLPDILLPDRARTEVDILEKRLTDVTQDISAETARLDDILGVETGLREKVAALGTDEAFIPEGPITSATPVFKRTKAVAREAGEAIGRPDLFREEPFVPLLSKAQRTFKKEASADYIEGVKRFGQEIDGPVPDGFAKSTLPELKGFVFPKELVGHMDATFEKFSNVKVVNNFLKKFDEVQGIWKGTATFINPSFHTRNFISNLWQMNLGDGLDPKSFGEAFNLIRKKGDITQMTPKQLRIWKEFQEFGLGGTGWVGADIDKQIKGFNQNWVFRAGGDVGAYVEDQAKLAMFINRLNKGVKSTEAAKDVRKFLFDYGDLSDLERNVFKRLFPFYTWTRNNIPLQVSMLIQNPGKFTPIAKVKRAVEVSQQDKPMDENLLPPWMQEGYTLFFGEDGKGMQRFFNLEGFLPAIDLTKIGSLDRAAELPFELASPLLKTPVELIANYDFFFERQISEFEGQRKEVFQVPVPARFEKFLRTIRPIGEFERLIAPRQPDVDTPFLERALRFGVGKLQKVDPRKSAEFKESDKDREISKINRDIKKARKRGDLKEVARLKKRIRDLR